MKKLIPLAALLLLTGCDRSHLGFTPEDIAKLIKAGVIPGIVGDDDDDVTATDDDDATATDDDDDDATATDDDDDVTATDDDDDVTATDDDDDATATDDDDDDATATDDDDDDDATATDDDDDATATDDDDDVPEPARVYVFHGSPDAGAIDIFQNGGGVQPGGAEFADDLALGELSAFRSVLPNEAVTFDIYPHEAGDARPSGTPLTLALPLLDADETYVIVIGGFAAPAKPDEEPAALITLTSGDLAQSNGTLARVIPVHAGADAGDVDLYSVNGALVTSLTTNAGFEFGESFTTGGGLSLGGATYRLGIGATGSNIPDLLFTATLTGNEEIFAVAFGSGNSLALALIARDNAGDFSLLGTVNPGTPETVNVNLIHASPDLPAVDLYIGPDEIAGNLALNGLARLTQEPFISVVIDLFPADTLSTTRPDDSTRLASFTVGPFASGSETLSMLTGWLDPLNKPNSADPDLTFLSQIVSVGSIDPGDLRLFALHGAADVPTVDLYDDNDDATYDELPGLSGIEYGELVPNILGEVFEAASGTTLAFGTVAAGEAQFSFTVDLDLFDGRAGYLIFTGANDTNNLTLLFTSRNGNTKAFSTPFSIPFTKIIRCQDKPITGIGLGTFHSCGIIKETGGVACVGGNSQGQLGDGTTTESLTTPVSVRGLPTKATQLGGGQFHTCALLDNGTVRCWGSNSSGQLGDGTTTNRSTAVQVSGITNAVELAVARKHACARLATGEIKCWGENLGQLGHADPTGESFVAKSTPVTVLGITTATAIAAGDIHSCAVLSDGTARCWGNTQFGQVGNGSLGGSGDFAPTPVAVTGITNAVDINAGAGYTCATTDDDKVFCWGRNENGKLGDGTTTTPRTTPVEVNANFSMAGIAQMAVGNNWACLQQSNIDPVCWGANFDGQFGNGNLTPGSSETPIAAVTDAPANMSGDLTFYGSETSSTVCATDENQVAFCWGQNVGGQLSTGNKTNSSTPLQMDYACAAPPEPL